jgi:hypothetical protein
MISELKDDEIMDFLMTSEFEDDYKPEELKYLLYKWRYFYRILSGKTERLKTDNEFEIKELKEKSKFNEDKYQKSLVDVADKQNIIDSLKNRKLTLKERFSGKIVMKEDENK